MDFLCQLGKDKMWTWPAELFYQGGFQLYVLWYKILNSNARKIKTISTKNIC